ncbi:MAG: hypothetical protein WC506_07100 [Candidatus Micrarchaeia archaeon]
MPRVRYWGMGTVAVSEYLRQRNDGLNGLTVIYKQRTGAFFCPATPAAGASPCWPSGVTPGVYHVSNYKETVVGTTNERNGGWSIQGSDGQLLPHRRFDTIKDGSMIMGEMNYSEVDSGQFNRAAAWGMNYAYTNYAPNQAESPSWAHPALSVNFIFKDGHCASFTRTGLRLTDSDWIPKK